MYYGSACMYVSIVSRDSILLLIGKLRVPLTVALWHISILIPNLTNSTWTKESANYIIVFPKTST